ncbi:hypothetical protein CASFOL_019373 [Castilleja foliolosa]|uniref:Uncharacterized protein n=1 Tax=Castilleja foliolosa TaxID=1961234 RepID=A0ABD3D790_9LAMI
MFADLGDFNVLVVNIHWTSCISYQVSDSYQSYIL